ncbi:MAG: DUF2484 family protein [Rhodobacteraceae bacterium]|nr:DUF2484 family protein [Paracoccaceae bacterium]
MTVSWSLFGVFVWIIVANVAAFFPSKRAHWPTAYALISVGLPLLVWVYVENGLLVTLLCLAAGMSILRWPVRYLIRWVRRVIFRQEEAQP